MLHTSGLVHGNFSLEKVLSLDDHFVIKGFEPGRVEDFPETSSDE
jgi:hypothetical protein